MICSRSGSSSGFNRWRPRKIRDSTVPMGTLEHAGDLPVVETLHIAQRDCHAELFGQRCQRLVDGVAHHDVGLDVDRIRGALDRIVRGPSRTRSVPAETSAAAARPGRGASGSR